VRLAAEEIAVLRGERGAAARFCLDVLCRLGELSGAPDLLPISRAHLDGNLYIHQAGLDFARHVRDLGARVAVPTTLNVTGRDAAAWQAFRVDPDWAARCDEMDGAYAAMGARPTYTCTPYLLPDPPGLGEDVAFGESNAIAFVNSVLGARTERYADFADLCAAVAGRVPRVGMHVPANRRAALHVRLGDDLPAALRTHESLFPVIGYALGELARDRVALLDGLPTATGRDAMKALLAAAASSGAVALVHVVGVTPEAPTLAAAGLPAGTPVEVLDLARLRAVRARMSAGAPDRVDLVALGSPHLSYDEASEVARRLAGRRVHASMQLWLTTSRAVHGLLAASGRLAALEAAGARVMRDACVVVQPVAAWGFRGMLTNSGKYAHYAASQAGIPARLASLADCVETAVAGRLVSDDDRLWA
jgi:predicted aconitase